MSDELNDGFAKGVRFCCGALLGAVLSVGVFLRRPSGLTSPFRGAGLLITLGFMLACGLGAMFGGDRFWTKQD